MRREQVDNDKGKESGCESDCKASGHKDAIPKSGILVQGLCKVVSVYTTFNLLEDIL